MDGAGEDVLGWLADGLAAGILGASVGTSLLLLGAPQAGVAAAAASVLVALAGLRAIKREPQRFRLPRFSVEQDPAPDMQDVLELLELAPPEPLLLEDRLEEAAPDSRVVQLFAARTLPTPGELQQRIAAHLAGADGPAMPNGGVVHELEVDAAAALRQALGDLRRSLA